MPTTTAPDVTNIVDLEACVVTLLQVQADHERDNAGASSGATATDLAADDYYGPAIL